MKVKRLLLILLVFYTQTARSQVGIIKEYEQLADILSIKFKYDSAAFYYNKAAKQYEERQEWLQSIKNYRLAGNALLKAARYDTSFNNCLKAQKLADKHLNEDNKDEMFEKSDVLIGLADVNEKKDHFDQELTLCKRALEITLKTDSSAKLRLANIWSKIGWAYRNLEKYDSALYFCSKALDLKVQLSGEHDINVGVNLFCLGNIYELKREYDKALELYCKALQLFVILNQKCRPEVGSIYLGIGNILFYKNKLDEALKNFFKAVDIQTFIYRNLHPDLASSYYDIGRVYQEKGEFNKALEYFYKTLQIETAFFGDQNSKLASTYNSIGVIYIDKGEHEKALEFQQKALKIWSSVYGLNHPYLAISYVSIGIIYKNEENFAKAIEYYQKALNICLSAYGERHPYVPFIYNCLGAVYFDNKEYNKAIDFFQKAMNLWILIEGENHPNVAFSYISLGIAYCDKGEYDIAIDFFQKVLQTTILHYGENHPNVAFSYYGLGKTYSKKGELFKALHFYQKALISNIVDFNDSSVYANPNLVNILLERDLLQTLIEKADILYKISKIQTVPDSAISTSLSTYELAFQLINKMRNEYTVEDSKLILSQNTKDYYARAAHVAMEFSNINHLPENTFKAFDFIEKGKSASLAARFNDLAAKHYAGLPDSLLEKEKDLRVRIGFLNIQITKENAKTEYDTLKINDWENEKFTLSRKLDSIVNYYETAFPSYHQYKYTSKLASVLDIQKATDKNTAVINYFLGDSSLFIAIITDNLYKLEEIKTDKTFKETVLSYNTKLRSADPEALLATSHQLYEKLVQPIKNYLTGKDHLIIIPDDFLYYVPFETLVENLTSAKTVVDEDYSKPNYLIKNYTISYHHSATLWYNSKKNERSYTSNHQLSFIGFAPVFDKKQNNGIILSSNIKAMDTTENNLACRAISADLKYFRPLPFSKDEVTEVVDLFSKKQKKAKAYIYTQANESNFKKYSGNYDIVHISSHGFSNDKEPALSGVVFSQPIDTSAKEDGILYTDETYNIQLSTDLIVLSACESGLGKLVKGEGIQALSRGFLYAGIPNVIFTLWRALDRPTKDLMLQFYTNVLNGKTYPEALREAKLKLINNPYSAFPHIWSQFILVGR